MRRAVLSQIATKINESLDLSLPQKVLRFQAVEAHDFNPSSWEAEAEIEMSL